MQDEPELPEDYLAFERLPDGRFKGLIQVNLRIWRIVTGRGDWSFYDTVW